MCLPITNEPQRQVAAHIMDAISNKYTELHKNAGQLWGHITMRDKNKKMTESVMCLQELNVQNNIAEQFVVGK